MQIVSLPCRAVLGYENEISRSMQSDCKGKQVWFTRLHDTDNGAFLRKEDNMLCMAEDGVVTPFLAQKDVKLRGLHNIENLLAAAAAVWGEVPVEAIQKVGSSASLKFGSSRTAFSMRGPVAPISTRFFTWATTSGASGS